MCTTILAMLPAVLGSSPAAVVIRDVPHVEQKPDFCGEACGLVRRGSTRGWRRLLTAYYRDFVRTVTDDASGHAALARVLKRNPRDMAAFESEWKAFVRGLRFE